MGLIEPAKRVLISLFFLMIGAVSFIAGTGQHAHDEARFSNVVLLSAFDTEQIRRTLIRAIEADASLDQRQLIEKLARVAPADPLPYEAALAMALAQENAELSDRLAARVLAHQPRSLSAHLHLLNTATQRAEYEAVIAHYERLVELNTLNNELLSDALVGVFRSSDDWQPLLNYLRQEPHSGEMVVLRLIEEEISLSELELVLLEYPQVHDEYLDRLVRNGEYQSAYDAWHVFAGVSDRARPLLFNGTFSSTVAPPPFNWDIDRQRAEVQERGGLYVTFLGKGSPLIARQILSAPAGEYVLRTEASGRMPENGGSLEWRLMCSKNRQELLISLIALTRIGETEVFEANARIPANDCGFQTLELRGRSGEFPKTSNTIVLDVSLSALEE